MQEENPLFKHDETAHDGEKQECVYEPQRSFRDPLTRQVHEGVRINRSLKDPTCSIMSTKSELQHGVLSRIEIRRGLSTIRIKDTSHTKYRDR